MKEAENFHQPGDSEVHGTQTKNGKYIRGVNDEGIERDGEHGRDGIDSEKHVGGFDYGQDNQQRRGVEPRNAFPAADKESPTLVVVRHWHPAPQSFYCRVRRWIDLMFTGKSEPDAAINQQRPQDVENPVETLDQANPGKNEEAPHQQRAEDSPKQDAVLMLLGYREIAEDHKEEEEIVHAEGEFEHVASDEFERHLAPLPEKDHSGKGRGQADPHGAPGKSLAGAHDAAAAVEDKKIQQQHGQREKVEQNPKVEQRASLKEIRIDDG